MGFTSKAGLFPSLFIIRKLLKFSVFMWYDIFEKFETMFHNTQQKGEGE